MSIGFSTSPIINPHSLNKTPSPPPTDAEIDLKHSGENLKPYFAKPSVEQVAAVTAIKVAKRKLTPKLPDELLKLFPASADQNRIKELLTIEFDLAELFEKLHKDLKETAAIDDTPYLTGSRSRQVLRGLSAMDTDITWYVTAPIFAQVKEAFSKFLFDKIQKIKKQNHDLLPQKVLSFIVQNVRKADKLKSNTPLQVPVSDLYFTKMQTEKGRAIYGLEACDIKFVCPKAITEPTNVALTDSFHISFKDGAIGCRHNNEWCSEDNFVLACSRLDNRQLFIEEPAKYTDLVFRILIDITRYGFTLQHDSGQKNSVRSAIEKFEAKSKDADQIWYKRHLGNHYKHQTSQITDCLNFFTIAKEAHEQSPENAYQTFCMIANCWPFSQCIPIAEMMGCIQKHPHMTEHFLNVVQGLFFLAWTKQSPDIAAYPKAQKFKTSSTFFCIGTGDDQCFLNVGKNPVEMAIAFLKSWHSLEDQNIFSNERPCSGWIQDLSATLGLSKVLPAEFNRNAAAESLLQAFSEPSPLRTALEHLHEGNLSPASFYQHLMQTADDKNKRLLELHALNYDLQRYSKEAARFANTDAIKWVKGLTLALQGFCKEQNATATQALFRQLPQMLSSTDLTFKKLLNRCIHFIMNDDPNQILALIEQGCKQEKELEAVQKEFLEIAMSLLLNLQKDNSHKTSFIAVKALKALVQSARLMNPSLAEGCLYIFKSIRKEQLKKKKMFVEITSIVNQLIAPGCVNVLNSPIQSQLLTTLHQLGFAKQAQKAWTILLQQPNLPPTVLVELCHKALEFNLEGLFEQVFPIGLKLGDEKLIIRLFEEGMAKLGKKFIPLLHANSSVGPTKAHTGQPSQSQAALSVKFITFLADQFRAENEAAQKEELEQAITNIGLESITFLAKNNFHQQRMEVFNIIMGAYQLISGPESLLKQGQLLLHNNGGNRVEVVINFIKRFTDSGINEARNELMGVVLSICKNHLAMLLSDNQVSVGTLLNNFIEAQIKEISGNRALPKSHLLGVLNSIQFLITFSPQYARLLVDRVFEQWQDSEMQSHCEHIAVLDECDKNHLFNDPEHAKWRLQLEYNALEALYNAEEGVSDIAIQRLQIAYGIMKPFTVEDYSNFRNFIYQIFVRVFAESIMSQKFDNLKKLRIFLVTLLTQVIRMAPEDKKVYAPLFSSILELLIHVLTYYPSMKNMLVEKLATKAINKPLLPLLHKIMQSKEYPALHQECFQNSIFRSAPPDDCFVEWVCMFNDEKAFKTPIGLKTKHQINEIVIQLMQLILNPKLSDRNSPQFSGLQDSLAVTHSLLVYTGILPEQIAEFEKLLSATDPTKNWRAQFSKCADFLFRSSKQIPQANPGKREKKK